MSKQSQTQKIAYYVTAFTKNSREIELICGNKNIVSSCQRLGVEGEMPCEGHEETSGHGDVPYLGRGSGLCTKFILCQLSLSKVDLNIKN